MNSDLRQLEQIAIRAHLKVQEYLDAKTCTKCLVRQNKEQYPDNPKTKDGKGSWCYSCSAESSRKYRKNNKKKVRETHGNYRRRLRMRVIKHLGGKCIECGIDDPRVLDIDHVDPVLGKREKSKYYFYRAILDNGEGFQVLCANCHRIKTSKDFDWKEVQDAD